MKLFAAVLAACLVMSVYSQATGGASAVASGGAAAALAGLQGGAGGFPGGNVMGLAAMSGQFGDSMQRIMRCQIMGIPVIMCMTMSK